MVHSVLFKNNHISRISAEADVERYFEVFKEESYRVEDYVERDTRLYTALLFFNLKMEQKVETLQR